MTKDQREALKAVRKAHRLSRQLQIVCSQAHAYVSGSGIDDEATPIWWDSQNLREISDYVYGLTYQLSARLESAIKKQPLSPAAGDAARGDEQ